MPNNDLPRVVWRKASRSNQQGACVELAHLTNGIAIRDSKNLGPQLDVGRIAWCDLASQIKAGRFDLT